MKRILYITTASFLCVGVFTLFGIGEQDEDGNSETNKNVDVGVGMSAVVYRRPSLSPYSIYVADPRVATNVPSHKQRREMAKDVLDILHTNISTGALNYKFNASGESVCLSAAGLAFIACGSSTTMGEYAPALVRIRSRMQGIMDADEFSMQPTWGTAAACVFLSELHRVTLGKGDKEKKKIQELLQKYADKLIAAQTPGGGWCHGFENVKNSLGYSDFVFVTSMATHGLALARREGVKVPKGTLTKAFAYMEESSNVSVGNIGYSPRSGQKGMSGPGRTAGALLALQAAGQIEGDLYKNASRVVRESYNKHDGARPQALLESGHASAQMGIAWAAWWAAASGHYDEFWQGQGASIAGRRNDDGTFKPAPTDGGEGAKEARSSEGGDFANAFHALMLVADYGGLSNSTLHRADPVRSIYLAQQYIKSIKKNGLTGSAPAGLQALADIPVQYGDFDRRPLGDAIKLAIAGLSADGTDASLQLIPELMNGGFQGKVHLHPKGKKIAVALEGNPVFFNRILGAEVQIDDPGSIFKKPVRPIKTRLSNKKKWEKRTIINLAKDAVVPDEIVVTITWTIDEKEFDQILKLTVIR